MMKNKFKIIHINIVFLAFCSDTFCMEVSKEKIENAEPNAGCSHWGLTHWVSGIKEYAIDRCLCDESEERGFKPIDTSRIYTIKYGEGLYSTSDCLCVPACNTLCTCMVFEDHPPSPQGLYFGTICCPIASLLQIISLSWLCCMPTPSDTCTLDVTGFHSKPYTLYYRIHDREDSWHAHYDGNCHTDGCPSRKRYYPTSTPTDDELQRQNQATNDAYLRQGIYNNVIQQQNFAYAHSRANMTPTFSGYKTSK